MAKSRKEKQGNKYDAYVGVFMIVVASFIAALFTSWIIPLVICLVFLAPLLILFTINLLMRKQKPIRTAFEQLNTFVEFVGSYLRF